MTTFENTLIKLEKGKTPSKDEMEAMKNAFKILLSKSKDAVSYRDLRKVNIDKPLSQSDIEEIKYFFKDWYVVGQEVDGIIPINFQNPKNTKCKCAFCGEENDLEDIYKVSSNNFPRCKVSVRICPDCVEKLDPYGRIGSDDTCSYEDAKQFLNNCKKLIPKYKKHPYYTFMKKCMENNYKLVSFDENLKKEYIAMINDYSTAMFNLIYAANNNTLDEELIRCIKELMEKTYDWSNTRNHENIPTFIPQVSNFVMNYQTYLGKFKICLNNIVANKEDYDDMYTLLKDIYPILDTFKEYNNPRSINGKHSIGAWIKSRAEKTKENHYIPEEDDVYALILTIQDEDSNYQFVKYDYNPKYGPKLNSYFKDRAELLYEEKLKRKDNSDFGKMLERMHEALKSMEVEEVADKPKTNRRKRHRQRSGYQPS